MSEPEWEQSDDVAETLWVWVTNPDGVTFPAVLGGFQKAGVVTFYVLHEDTPDGEESGERCEFFREVPGVAPPRGIYEIRRQSTTSLAAVSGVAGNPEGSTE